MKIKKLITGICDENCYLIIDEAASVCAVIDPGAADPRIRAALEGLELQYILLTHGHFDHVEGISSINPEGKVPVYLHPGEESQPVYLTGGPIPASHSYTEGTVLPFGDSFFTVLSTPGHSPGSVCLRIGNTLFTGDTMLRGGGGRLDLPGGDEIALRASIARLCALPESLTVCPGHGEDSTIGWERTHNILL